MTTEVNKIQVRGTNGTLLFIVDRGTLEIEIKKGNTSHRVSMKSLLQFAKTSQRNVYRVVSEPFDAPEPILYYNRMGDLYERDPGPDSKNVLKEYAPFIVFDNQFWCVTCKAVRNGLENAIVNWQGYHCKVHGVDGRANETLLP
jgi:hypothetical protein